MISIIKFVEDSKSKDLITNVARTYLLSEGLGEGVRGYPPLKAEKTYLVNA